MAEIKQVSQITSLPGIRRDGTQLDGDYFTGGQWVRFQRGRPKKMGGYRQITNELTGPIRAVTVWSRGLMNAIYNFSDSKVELVLVDKEGVGNGRYDLTPSGFTSSDSHIWSVDTMYDDAVGSQGTIVVAVATNALKNIDDTTSKQVYYAIAGQTSTAFQPITGLTVSGGVCCISPYLVYYGADGLVGWSDVNQPQTLTGGDAGQDRVTGAKIVKALPLRSGTGPGALLWSLDSLIKMDYVGGAAVFRFTTVSSQTSILSQNSVIEYDGSYFWAGVDRFLAYSGGQVQELPNVHNLNWFFDNLNYDQRQKVWAAKVPRFGEIWWFYPRGDATECTHAVIYNVREKTWYDCELARSAGYYSQVFRLPVMTDSVADATARRMTITTSSGSFNAGNSIVGVTSGAVGVIQVAQGSNTYQVNLTGPIDFVVGESISNQTVSGTGTLTASKGLYGLYVHETGINAVVGETETAIESYFETSDFGYPTGGAQQNDIKGLNRWTRLIRVEPDFVQNGEMSLEVIGREFAQQEDTISEPFPFDRDTGKIDMREQRRQIRLRFTSNTLNGNYEMGRVILHTEPGDVRS